MGEFFTSYALFTAKLLTGAIVFLIVFGMLGSMRRKFKNLDALNVENLTQKYRDLSLAIKAQTLPKKAFKKLAKETKLVLKQTQDDDDRKRLFVVDFKGDLRASAVASLREEVTAVLTTADPGDEVLLRLENAGGVVHDHGLAASQLARLRDREINLTVAVDKVAASGGYLMACVANQIISAPFAVVGSIGVVAQLPNFNRLLESKGIDFEMITAGKHKRSLTLFGKNTDEGRTKFQQEIEDVHELFQTMIRGYRPSLDMERVATGEAWYGERALGLNLVDQLGTSDDFLIDKSKSMNVYRLHFEPKRSWKDKAMGQVESHFKQMEPASLLSLLTPGRTR